ncbi:MAG TPA: hypothetical protein VKP78_02620 [bacterium]|nr:hypothetical protein [bacterium]
MSFAVMIGLLLADIDLSDLVELSSCKAVEWLSGELVEWLSGKVAKWGNGGSTNIDFWEKFIIFGID